MSGTSLGGRSILIVEDETLIALDIVEAFENAGAVVFAARSMADAIRFVEHDGLSAAVLDFGLGDSDTSGLCLRLEERRIPFILHSGYSRHGPACRSGIVIPKPASPATLIETVVGLLQYPGEETHIMPRDRVFRDASLPPEVLKVLAELSDEVWASVAADFSHDPDEIETAQIRLRTIILDLAKDGQLGPLEITQTASRLMRKANVEMAKRESPTSSRSSA
jgi:CheY-like chemotaxis protein